MDIVYLTHPVSPEEKAKHKGKKIVDAKFEPKADKVDKPKRKKKE